jgi:uncharacterized repeat protein (TIGR03803 family)
MLGLAAVAAVTLPASAQSTASQKLLYVFGQSSSSDTGFYPYGGLTKGPDGRLYGTTLQSGAFGNDTGLVYAIKPNGGLTVLHIFTGDSTDPGFPMAALTVGSDGNLYGTASGAKFFTADSPNGSVFRLSPTGTESVLYSFKGAPGDGTAPNTALIQGGDGDFYGTTAAGGAHNAGCVFKISLSGEESLVYSFAGGADGADPAGKLLLGSDGNLYGTTLGGGKFGLGTVYRLTLKGSESVLYSFGSQKNDGMIPFGGLVQTADGNFYGTTSAGGAAAGGTVFQMTPAGAMTVLHAFTSFSANDGSSPIGSLTLGTDGNLYGMTTAGGSHAVRYGGGGTAFMITPQGNETVLFSFGAGYKPGGEDGTRSARDGLNPADSLLEDGAGVFYGATQGGGSADAGTVFKLTVK